MKNESESMSSLAGRLLGQEMFHVLEKARSLEAAGEKVYHLELGDPHAPADEMIIAGSVDSLRKGNWHYATSRGNASLRKAVAQLESHGKDYSLNADQVVIGPANFFITVFLAVTCNAGDKVVVITPCFPSYIASARMLGLNLVECPTTAESGYKPDKNLLSLLEREKPKALIINSANNPTGAVYDPSFMKDVVEVARKNDIWILSDETYAHLTYQGVYYSLLNEDYKKIVVLSSFSKTFRVPGLRMGYQISKCQPYVEKSALFISTTLSCAPSFLQDGCEVAIRDAASAIGRIEKQRIQYAELADQLFKSLSPHVPASFRKPESAFYLLVPLPKGIDGSLFSDGLLSEHKVAVTPGISFGEDYKNYFRISFCGDKQEVMSGVSLINKSLDALSRSTVSAS